MSFAYVSPAPGAALVKTAIELPSLGRNEVEIEISHCGVCHSDLHVVDGDFGDLHPVGPGHEIVGRVVARGEDVDTLRIGARVGVGWLSNSCHGCACCRRGDDNLCADSTATGMGRAGGFADRIHVDARFAHPIPDGLASEVAAPLLCAGLTVYSALADVSPAAHVGVIGIGGLGHLAVQFANERGHEVTALSTSPDKADEAAALGAHHFVLHSDPDALAAAANRFDFIVSTVNVALPWDRVLACLRPRGTLCLLGAIPGDLAIPSAELTEWQKTVRGGTIGNRATMREMLAFAAHHGIAARTEVMPMARVNDAIERVRRNAARYRVVLTNQAEPPLGEGRLGRLEALRGA